MSNKNQDKKTTLFVGLGNPGPQYALTRHNVGFMILDSLADAHSLTFHKDGKGMLAKGIIQEQRVLLFKPMTYMNLSGEAVSPLMKYYNITLDSVCVVHDDLDLDSWRIKVKKGGGSGGHNGLKSLDQYITPQYWRVRIGIGRPTPPMDASAYVLSLWRDLQPDDVHELADHLAKWPNIMPEQWAQQWQANRETTT